MAPERASGPRSELAKLLIDRAPDNMAKVFFACGGSDSNEAAINMARTVTGKSKIFSMYRSYHGSTLGEGNLSGDPRRFELEHPAAGGFIKFFNPYTYHSKLKFANDKEKTDYYLGLLEEQIVYEGPDQIAAVEVESVVGANGILIPPEGYLQGLRKLTEKYGILLICDEVMAGFYRTGKLFGFMNWDIKPDIITFAKGITCGYVQLGGIIISKEIADFYENKPFQYGLTYSGHSLACAVGVATLKSYEKLHIEENVQKVGKVLGELLEEQKKKHKCVGDVRYIGLFGNLELVKDKETTEPLVPYGNDKEGVMGKIHELLLERGFAPVYISCISGVNKIREEIIQGAYMLGANRFQVFVQVILPASLPDIFTGLRTALGVEYTTLVAAEMVAAKTGIGWMVLDASNWLKSDVVFFEVILMGITGILMNQLLLGTEQIVVHWNGK